MNVQGLRDGVLDAVRQPDEGIVAPGTEHDDGELGRAALGQVLLRDLAQVIGHAGAQDGTLAHAAGAVEQRQPRGQQVGGDDLPLRFAPEEERRVFFRVGHQSLVGCAGPGVVSAAHGAPPAAGSA